MYNIAQTISAPVMAIAANSPLVFGKRLWHESRIAMFQQALDTRVSHDYIRDYSPRVNFGDKWLNECITDIYKDDITKFRVLIADDMEENALQAVRNGKVPKLKSLQVHNSTVYRWNRPCYGISDNGKPHLRIENRILPSGPTVKDELANACFWLGLMTGYGNHTRDGIPGDLHIIIDELREFYFKRENLSGSEKQVIFDVWNSSSVGSADYGRFRVEVRPGIAGISSGSHP